MIKVVQVNFADIKDSIDFYIKYIPSGDFVVHGVEYALWRVQ